MPDPNRPSGECFEHGLDTLAFVEETATISKRQVSAGKVVIRTDVETEDRMLRETLAGERVDVERVPMDRVVAVAPAVRTEGDVTIISIVEERLVVEPQLLVVEEIRLHRLATTESVDVPVTLRKQRAFVERVDADGNRDAKSKGRRS